MKKIFLIGFFIANLGACGVKGHLYMPPKKDRVNSQFLNCQFCLPSDWEGKVISL